MYTHREVMAHHPRRPTVTVPISVTCGPRLRASGLTHQYTYVNDVEVTFSRVIRKREPRECLLRCVAARQSILVTAPNCKLFDLLDLQINLNQQSA